MEKKEREEIIKKIKKLITKYEENKEFYDSKNEPTARKDLILPLLDILGWNIEDAREVYPEDPIKGVGFVDFSLLIDGHPVVFIETKKTSENLDGKDSSGKLFSEKTMEYAWKHKPSQSWAVLTNFKEIRLYNSSKHQLVFSIPYDKLSDEFDSKTIYLSKDFVREGKLGDLFAQIAGAEIDADFLADLLIWREKLGNSLWKSNKLTIEQVNEETQRILDRLILIRIAEDKGILPRCWLKNRYLHWEKEVINKEVDPFIQRLKMAFENFESIYNTELFKQSLCDELKIDDETLEWLLKDVETIVTKGKFVEYHGIYAYDFTTMVSEKSDIDILGNTYESYLGHILIEKNGKLIIEEKPEVAKSEGIIYTRPYVVNFIVDTIIGQLIKEKKPEDIPDIKILDPACGSGSFLIKAYKKFKAYYEKYNLNILEKRRNSPNTNLSEISSLQGISDIEQKILKENIYGVDLDSQAIEVTKLNLWVRALNSNSSNKKLQNLEHNILHGNSIITHDSDKLLSKSKEELEKLLGKDWKNTWDSKYPFNYKDNFTDVINDGGFCGIIGNPPYINMQKLPIEQSYCKKIYSDIFAGENDIWYYFLRNSLELISEGGLIGFITSRYFLEAYYAKDFRKFILENAEIKAILDFGNIQLFPKRNVLTTILILKKNSKFNHNRKNNVVKILRVKKWDKDLSELFKHIREHLSVPDLSSNEFCDDFIDIYDYKQSNLTSDVWIFKEEKIEKIKNKMGKNSWLLGNESFWGVGKGFETGLDRGELNGEKRGVFVVSKKEVEDLNLEKNLLLKLTHSRDIEKFIVDYKDEYVINTRDRINIDDYPKIKSHLEQFKYQLTCEYFDVCKEKELRNPNTSPKVFCPDVCKRKDKKGHLPKGRYDWQRGNCKWYALGNLRNIDLYDRNIERILCPIYSRRHRFAYDPADKDHKFYGKTDTYIITNKNSNAPVSLKYILALLNSNLIEFFHKNTAKLKRDGYYEYVTNSLSKIPIKKPSKEVHDKLVNMVDKIIHLLEKRKKILDSFMSAIETQAYALELFEKYYDNPSRYGIIKNPLSSLNEKKTVTAINIREEENELVFALQYDDGWHDVLKCHIENEKFRKFFHWSIKNFIIAKVKNRIRFWGKDKLITTILKSLCVPRFEENHEFNINKINQIMREVFDNIGKNNLSELEGKISKIKNNINEEVYELYGITHSEKEVINDFLKNEPKELEV